MANSLNTITVNGITYNAEEYAKQQAAGKGVRRELDKDAFLKLLVTQLEYQDPLDPQDNSQYLSQLAQFSSLEQMSNVATNLGKLSSIVNNIDTSLLVGQLSSMIGKEVHWSEKIPARDGEGKEILDENGNKKMVQENYKGTVEGVKILDGAPFIIAKTADGAEHRVEISSVSLVTR